MAAKFQREHGTPAADLVPFRLWWFANFTGREEQRPAARERALAILAKAYPGYDPYNPPFINAVDVHDQLELFRRLEGVRFVGLERSLLEGFRAVVRADSAVDVTRCNLDRLACVYISRLAGRGYDDEFRAFLAARIKTLKMKDEGLYERLSLELLVKWQERLGK